MPVKATRTPICAAMEPRWVTVGVPCAAIAPHRAAGVMTSGCIMSATGKVGAAWGRMGTTTEVATARGVASSRGMTPAVRLRHCRRRSRQYRR
jgi:hypothetical protein